MNDLEIKINDMIDTIRAQNGDAVAGLTVQLLDMFQGHVELAVSLAALHSLQPMHTAEQFIAAKDLGEGIAEEQYQFMNAMLRAMHAAPGHDEGSHKIMQQAMTLITDDMMRTAQDRLAAHLGPRH